VGRHEPDAQIVFGAPVGGLEAPVCEPEILANRRDQIPYLASASSDILNGNNFKSFQTSGSDLEMPADPAKRTNAKKRYIFAVASA